MTDTNIQNNRLEKNEANIAEMLTANAVIARDIGYMRQEVDKLVKKLDELSGLFISRAEFDREMEIVDVRFKEIENVKSLIEKMIIGAIVGGVLGLLGLSLI